MKKLRIQHLPGRHQLFPLAQAAMLAGHTSLRTRDALPGLTAFAAAFKPKRALLVGDDGIAVKEFLLRSAETWIE